MADNLLEQPNPTTLTWTESTDPHALAARLLKEQFEEWTKTFQPIELAALNKLSFNNPTVLPTALQEARTMATGGADSMKGVIDRQNRSMGIKPTEAQTKATNRILNLDRAAMIANAENQTRENIRAQDEAILLGATPNPNIVRPVESGG